MSSPSIGELFYFIMMRIKNMNKYEKILYGKYNFSPIILNNVIMHSTSKYNRNGDAVFN